MSRMRVRMELSMYGIPEAWGEIVYVRECLGEELLIHCKHKIKTTNYYGGERKLQPALEGKPIPNHTPNSMLSSQCRALETTEFLPFFLRMQVLNSALLWKPNLMQSWKNKASTQLSPRWTHPVPPIPLMPKNCISQEVTEKSSCQVLQCTDVCVTDYNTASILPKFCVIQHRGRV